MDACPKGLSFSQSKATYLLKNILWKGKVRITLLLEVALSEIVGDWLGGKRQVHIAE